MVRSVLISCTILLFVLELSVFNMSAVRNDVDNYLSIRQQLIAEEESNLFGFKLKLNTLERKANEILMRYKNEELSMGLKNPNEFLPAKSFLAVSRRITASRVFATIRGMPKGGVLHAHLSAIVARDFILSNVTHRPHLYVCRGKKFGALKLRFFDRSPARSKNADVGYDNAAGLRNCRWKLLRKVRKREKRIDRRIAEALSMNADDDFYTDFKGADSAWKRFLGIFHFVKPLVTYRPVFEDILYRIMEEMYEDNVQFIEIRTPFMSLYELNGYKHDPVEVVNLYKKVLNRFVKNNPDFRGIKWIYSPQRNVPRSRIAEYVKNYRHLKNAYPNDIVGFDLVGQEDKGCPLKCFVKELLKFGEETEFFFHAGETNWSGQDSDENLIDAILLNAKRIGHGYALLKHPLLMELVKEKEIAIEINPISNQVLRLVKDLRNHPAGYFFAQNLPVVVSNDDPGFWGARALSYDFYETFMGIMSSKADLRSLKQLAINSIIYSSMNRSEVIQTIKVWKKRWRKFVVKIIKKDAERKTQTNVL